MPTPCKNVKEKHCHHHEDLVVAKLKDEMSDQLEFIVNHLKMIQCLFQPFAKLKKNVVGIYCEPSKNGPMFVLNQLSMSKNIIS